MQRYELLFDDGPPIVVFVDDNLSAAVVVDIPELSVDDEDPSDDAVPHST